MARGSGMSQAVKSRSQNTEQQALQKTKKLVEIAIASISHFRGLFPESYFVDNYVKTLALKVKKLLPLDADSRRLLQWTDKGVFDALEKKYLKFLLFGICVGKDGPLIEEYQFSFTYANESETVQMSISRANDAKSAKKFDSRDTSTSVSRLVRTLLQLMRMLDNVPDERTIIMKLLYYDDITPEDYEPPFFRSCTEEDKMTWAKPPVKMRVGDMNSRHYAVCLKVKSALDPSEDENQVDTCDNEQQDGEKCTETQEASGLDSTIGLVREIGSDVTRQCVSNSASQKRPLSPPTSGYYEPALTRESAVSPKDAMEIDGTQTQSQDPMNLDNNKASKVKDPIYQLTKKQRTL